MSAPTTNTKKSIEKFSVQELQDELKTQRLHPRLLEFLFDNNVQGIDFMHADFVEKNIANEREKLKLLPAHIDTLKQVHSKYCTATTIPTFNLAPSADYVAANMRPTVERINVLETDRSALFRVRIPVPQVQALTHKKWAFASSMKIGECDFRLAYRSAVATKAAHKDENFLSLYAQNVSKQKTSAEIKISVCNTNPSETKSKTLTHTFNPEMTWGFSCFTRINKVCNSANGFVDFGPTGKYPVIVVDVVVTGLPMPDTESTNKNNTAASTTSTTATTTTSNTARAGNFTNVGETVVVGEPVHVDCYDMDALKIKASKSYCCC